MFDRKQLNDEGTALKKLQQLIQQESGRLVQAGVQIPNLQNTLKLTAQNVSKMGLTGLVEEKTLDQFLMMQIFMTLKPELGKSLGMKAFELEMNRIEKALSLDPNNPKSLEELIQKVSQLLKENPANKHIPAPDIEKIASKMAEKLMEKILKPKPEPEKKKDEELEEKQDSKKEKRNEYDLTPSELTTMSLIGINPRNPSNVTYAPLALYHTQGNPLGVVDQNPQKEVRSFLDNVVSAVMEKKEQEMELDHRVSKAPTPFNTKPVPK